MSNQSRFLMMIGIAGSGKSSMAKEMMEEREDIVLLSSDSIREELYGSEDVQEDHAKVFSIMLERTKEAFGKGLHVIYDATNISRKKRKHLLAQLPKDVKKVACYVSAEYRTILEQNNNRDRVVPNHVIARMYKNLQIPTYEEGWDVISFFSHDEVVNKQYPKQFIDAVNAEVLLNRDGYTLMAFLAEYFEEFFGVYDMPQDSSYHSFSVSRHIYYVYKYTLDNYPEGDDKLMMLWTALLHDVGKHFCKSFKNRKGEDSKYANFIGHEHVGSQMAITMLTKMGFGEEFTYKVAKLIQFHMYLLDEKASKKKLIDRVGIEDYKRLEFLRDADNYAH
jgi:predicted kinase